MKKKKSTKRLFYRNAPYLESLVFAPPKVAEYNSAIHHALVDLLGAVISTLDSRITTFGLADVRGAVHAGFDEGAWQHMG
jgi:hypothetical protein